MKVLVTGSAGHAGKTITTLIGRYHEVIGLDKVKSPATHIVGDITDWASIKKITKGFDAIIHTASLHAPHVGIFSRQQFIDINLKGTLYLLEACKLHNIPKLVYTSTTSVYGEAMKNTQKAVWVTENLTPVPRDIYDITKLGAEALCKDFYQAENVSVLCLRVSRFWHEPLKDRLFYRMFRGLDVRDVAQAHQLALENEQIGFDIFNISSRTIFEKKDIFKIKNNPSDVLKERVPGLVNFFRNNNWTIPESIDRVYVIEKAKKKLGYHPVFNIKEMLDSLTNM